MSLSILSNWLHIMDLIGATSMRKIYHAQAWAMVYSFALHIVPKSTI